MAITQFAAVGTLISSAIISYGATKFFSRMYNGDYLGIRDYLGIEGVWKNATSVVLVNAIHSFDQTHIIPTIALQILGTFLYLFFANMMLGVLTGLVSAYIINKLYFGRHSTDREVALMSLMGGFLSYMLAELLLLSGIQTVCFYGMVMSRYTRRN